MSFGDDEEILQDFLLEAGEIIEQLSEQLVELEQSPDDKDLLNAIFRGFHTVKGGAGFLQLNAMVDCCHVTENLFDILRNGDRDVDAELMDVVLQALDTVTQQFQQLQNGEAPNPADPELIRSLETLVAGETLADDSSAKKDVDSAGADHKTDGELDISDAEFEGFLDAIDDGAGTSEAGATSDASTPNTETTVSADSGDEISEDEFEALLDQLHGEGKGPSLASAEASNRKDSANASANSDEITDSEFEDLLDQIHGAGKGPKGTSAGAKPDAAAAAASSNNDEITAEEFEGLLDELHGKGSGPSKASSASKSASSPPKLSSVKSEPPAAETPKKTIKSAPKRGGSEKGAAKKAGAQQNPPQGETTVRVDTQRLDDIMNMVGELVLVRNRLVRLGEDSQDESMQQAVANLDVVTADLQSSVMKTRMQPIKKVFGRFPRVVRDLARNLKKEINLELQGEDTDLDKNLVEALADPLVHLVRNSVDHGIELPDVREEKGKSRIGKIILSAEQEGDHILLSIVDDGGGMDAEKLRGIAVDKGLMDADAAARLTDTEAFSLIFAPGFSTKKEISDVSGRGVGMDVVKTKITQLNGSVEIQSEMGVGTTIQIKVPLTLAIMPTLMIMLNEQTFALPLVSVNEIFHMDLSKISIVDGQECIIIRDKTIPLFNLKQWLVKDPVFDEELTEGHVVIVSVGTQRVGFIVDQLIGQEEVVIKPLGKLLHGTAGMSGATITGDGTIALIIDVPSLLKRYAAGSRRVA